MKAILQLVILLVCFQTATAQNGASLAERLGFKPTDKILIINGDDAGMSHGANVGTIQALEKGLMTTSTIMTPCPWFNEIAAYAKSNPKADFGVHLTHTAEWKNYRWGPVANKADVPGLVDPSGYLWPDVEPVYQHATPREAEIEGRAQIRKALDAGIDVTHLDSHMGTLQLNLEYYEVYRKLAKEFDLPLRMASQDMLAALGGGQLRARLAADDIICPDYLIHGMRQEGEPIDAYWKRVLRDLKPGVTELYIHAAVAGEEMQAITGSWKERATELELFTTDPEIQQILKDQNVKRIGYRALRDLQRSK